MTMKKIILSTCVFYLLSAAAYAEIGINVNLGGPVYAEPAPVYVAPYPTYYDPRHRNHDFSYWQGQRRAHGHVDNGRHEGHR